MTLHRRRRHFYCLVRLIESADKTSRLFDVKSYILLPSVTDVGTPFDDIQWAVVRRPASALWKRTVSAMALSRRMTSSNFSSSITTFRARSARRTDLYNNISGHLLSPAHLESLR